jgi:hypothetical protein
MRRFFATFILCLFGLLAWIGINKDKLAPSGPRQCSAKDRSEAFVMSKTFVSRALKAPSTAEYPWMSSDGVNVTHKGSCDYSVLAYVDAQNSFGAKLRSRYFVDLRLNPADGTWTAQQVNIQ